MLFEEFAVKEMRTQEMSSKLLKLHAYTVYIYELTFIDRTLEGIDLFHLNISIHINANFPFFGRLKGYESKALCINFSIDYSYPCKVFIHSLLKI